MPKNTSKNTTPEESHSVKKIILAIVVLVLLIVAIIWLFAKDRPLTLHNEYQRNMEFSEYIKAQNEAAGNDSEALEEQRQTYSDFTEAQNVGKEAPTDAKRESFSNYINNS